MKLTWICCLIVSMGWAQSEMAQVGFTTKIGQQMPDLTVELLDGRMIDTKELRGKVILLDFWGAKCGGCLLEMKRLVKNVLVPYEDREDFFLLAIEVQNHKKEEIEGVAKRLGFQFPLAYENGKDIVGLYFQRVLGLPRTLIIDRKGKIVYQAFGYTDEEFDDMLKVLRRTVDEKE